MFGTALQSMPAAQPPVQAMASPFALPYPQLSWPAQQGAMINRGPKRVRPLARESRIIPSHPNSSTLRSHGIRERQIRNNSCPSTNLQSKPLNAKVIHLALDGIARSWYINLPVNSIYSWEQLRDVFVLNFRGTYEEPKTQQDLMGIRQRQGESTREYIRRFL